jgi:palmitoyltransferase
MLVMHVKMICLNVSTVENHRIADMRERDSALLGEMFNFWQTVKKRRTKKEWDEEWGRFTKEGNIWWLGDSRKNWESVMGKNIWWWFCEFIFISTVRS